MKAVVACFALLVICLPVSSMQSVALGADPDDDGVKAFETLKTAFRSRADEYYARREKAKPDERLKLFERIHPGNTMPSEFFRLENVHRGSRVGLSCLHHLISTGGSIGNSNLPIAVSKRKAIVILHEHYADHADLDLIFAWMNSGARYVEGKALLRRAAESPHRRVRGAALLTLAKTLLGEVRFFEITGTMLELQSGDPKYANALASTKKRRSFWSDVKPVESRREALEVIEQVVFDYPDVLQPPRTGYGPILLDVKREKRDPLTQRERRPLVSLAKELKFELTSLNIGDQAPDINGPDAFGKPLRLNDYRGKVVVVMFSFKGCGPCEAMYPNNRELLKTMTSRPFAIVGVMSDEKIDTVNQAVANKDITWPVWWEGPKRSVSEVWNVKSWPGIFILDHKGIIRYKNLRGDHLNLAVKKLVVAAEQAQRK